MFGALCVFGWWFAPVGDHLCGAGCFSGAWVPRSFCVCVCDLFEWSVYAGLYVVDDPFERLCEHRSGGPGYEHRRRDVGHACPKSSERSIHIRQYHFERGNAHVCCHA